MFDEEVFRLQSDDEQFKEVYAYFGLCIYYFQVLEHQLINMILLFNKTNRINIPKEEYDEIFKQYSDKTMGKLIEKVTLLYQLTEENKKESWMIHKKRN